MPGFTLIGCVVNMGDASKAMKIGKKHGVKGGTISVGRGTVNSRLLNFLRMNEVQKEIVTMVVETQLAAEAIKSISDEMKFARPHHGIAFSYSVAEFTGRKNTVRAETTTTERRTDMYNAIYTIVEKGKAEDVIDAATKAGARGGTIMNARGAGVHEVQKLFSVEIEPEKEVVFILTKSADKNSIVDSIRSHLKLDEPCNGLMYVLDVNEVYGLY